MNIFSTLLCLEGQKTSEDVTSSFRKHPLSPPHFLSPRLSTRAWAFLEKHFSCLRLRKKIPALSDSLLKISSPSSERIGGPSADAESTPKPRGGPLTSKHKDALADWDPEEKQEWLLETARKQPVVFGLTTRLSYS